MYLTVKKVKKVKIFGIEKNYKNNLSLIKIMLIKRKLSNNFFFNNKKISPIERYRQHNRYNKRAFYATKFFKQKSSAINLHIFEIVLLQNSRSPEQISTNPVATKFFLKINS